jgi:glucosamine-6-phosphate deaminase
MSKNLSSQVGLTYIPKKYYDPQDDFELAKLTRFEKIPCKIFETESIASKMIALQISTLIKQKNTSGENTVLGLTNGRSMLGIYNELIELYNSNELSFKNVHAVILYEFYPLKNSSLGCLSQIKSVFFDKVDFDEKNIHFFNSNCDRSNIINECNQYENIIEQLGGIDIQLLGVGKSGNIGYNESGTLGNSKSRLVLLDDISKQEISNNFGVVENVPPSALIQGISTILKSKRIILVAWGEQKSHVIKSALEGNISDVSPSSYLQNHSNIQIITDLNAACELTRISKPWLVTSCDWDEKLIRRAVVWLCKKTTKPILKLTTKDYLENGLGDLIFYIGSAYDINIKIFNDLQHTITGWPGGKPNADDSSRPERALPYPKKVLVFSPHPDDDVISMGGTLNRLIEQNHEVHVAYQTSGNIAVANEELNRYILFLKGFLSIKNEKRFPLDEDILRQIELELDKGSTIQQSDDILKLKSLVRSCEATLACEFIHVHSQNIHFMNLPFYETGNIKKKPADIDDVKETVILLNSIKPSQIFVAGDLTDPHGTHKVCLNIVLAAVDELKNEEWMKDCRIWMYRGAWKEWEIEYIEMAVPLSPEQVRIKRNAILKHHSQMESAPFMGNDERLFWQRAEERNRATAKTYCDLGLASYEAMEAFVRYYPI